VPETRNQLHGIRGRGLVQHVFHSPARIPAVEPSRRPVRRAAKRKTLYVIACSLIPAGVSSLPSPFSSWYAAERGSEEVRVPTRTTRRQSGAGSHHRARPSASPPVSRGDPKLVISGLQISRGFGGSAPNARLHYSGGSHHATPPSAVAGCRGHSSLRGRYETASSWVQAVAMLQCSGANCSVMAVPADNARCAVIVTLRPGRDSSPLTRSSRGGRAVRPSRSPVSTRSRCRRSRCSAG